MSFHLVQANKRSSVAQVMLKFNDVMGRLVHQGLLGMGLQNHRPIGVLLIAIVHHLM